MATKIRRRTIVFFINLDLCKLFFKKKYPLNLHTDVHSHLVPGVDDGSRTVDDSLAMIKRMVDLGYRKFITTPHISETYYPNTLKGLRARFAVLEKAVKTEFDGVEIKLGAEYMVDQALLGMLKKGEDLLSWNGFLLIETSFYNLTMLFDEVLFEIQSRNLIPVYAHPERYVYYKNKWDRLAKIKSQGVWFQTNIGSFSGLYGKPVQKMARAMLSRGWIDFIGSDLHNIEQVNVVESALLGEILNKKSRNTTFKNNELIS